MASCQSEPLSLGRKEDPLEEAADRVRLGGRHELPQRLPAVLEQHLVRVLARAAVRLCACSLLA